MRYTITIENLRFHTIIGILPKERELEQPVVVDAVLGYTYHEDRYIDYAKVCDLIVSHIRTRKFRLLEEALASTAELLHTTYPMIEELTLTLKKPTILPNATPSITLSLKYR